MRLIKGKISNQTGIELISIHIPKTGGRSFHEVLKQVYGKTLDQRFEKHHFFPKSDKQETAAVDLPEGISGIHGHLHISQVLHIINTDNPRVITWVRDPVDRVISNYYYFMKRIREGDTTAKQKGKALFSLLDYASQPRRQNRMTAILSGIELIDFFFIGIMENFASDLKILSRKMDWPELNEAPHINNSSSFKQHNDCTTQYSDIDEAMRMEVARLNNNDILLYAEVKKLRGIE